MIATSSAAGTLHRVRAIVRRDLRREVSYHFQLGLRMVGIAFAVAGFFFLGKLVGSDPQVSEYEGGYFTFVLLGVVVMLYAEVAVRTVGDSFAAAQGDDTLEVLLSTSTPLSTLLGGTFVVPLLFATLEAAAFFAFAWLFGGFAPSPSALLAALPVLMLTVGAFCALGVFGATVIVLTKRGDPFSVLALQASNLLAGVLFPIALLPDALQALARLVPTYYGLQALRAVLLTGAGLGDVTGDLLALVAFNVVLLPLSVWALSKGLRFARVAGTLGNR